MERPNIRVIDGETVIDREMNDEEFACYEARVADQEAKETALAEKAKTKTATLARLGLTADEVASLLS